MKFSVLATQFTTSVVNAYSMSTKIDAAKDINDYATILNRVGARIHQERIIATSDLICKRLLHHTVRPCFEDITQQIGYPISGRIIVADMTEDHWKKLDQLTYRVNLLQRLSETLYNYTRANEWMD